MSLTRSLLLLAPVAALAACGGSSPSSSSTPPPAASSPTVAQCEGAHLGQSGVISLQCNGTATVKVTTGGVSKELTGGVCTNSAGLFVVNVGVVTDHTFVGTRPDFVSVNTSPAGGGGQDTAASIVLGGKFYGDSGRFGGTTVFTADHKGLTFNGTALDGETATIVVSGC
ncbi:MAG: hypothetical protein M3Z98_04630 [Candidatus Dormibacteraeota bacterium]|nr:hypothetical protein [Candidatus Dormibacteraeota bacterium]